VLPTFGSEAESWHPAEMTKGAEFDVVIRGGLIVDGSGTPGVQGDVAIVGDRIVAVGTVDGGGREEIDAGELVVAPGFVDPHTHMDAQVFWDDLGQASCWHGVTTAVMGNCGFTLAPVHPEAKELVVANIERAEDIAAEAMAAGLDWNWSTFASYMDAVEAAPKGLNYAASIGHSALRTWAMGERAFSEQATEDDLEVMVTELRSALQAGAAGFTTSRSAGHMTPDDRPVASRLASWDELSTLVHIVGRESQALFQLAHDRPRTEGGPEAYRQALGDLAVSSGVRMMYGTWENPMGAPGIDFIEETAARGGDTWALTHCRSVLAAQSFLTKLAFDSLEEWHDLRSRPHAEQIALLRDPEVKARLVHAAHHGTYGKAIGTEATRPKFETMQVLLSPYLPNPTVAEEAQRRGVDPVEAMIDIALEHDLDVFFLQIITPQKPEGLVDLMRHPRTAMGFSDSGAHVSQIFDASIFSHLLAYWVREKEAFPLEEAVQMITSRPAQIWRLHDRGRLAPGYAADVAIFDPKTVGPLMPKVVADLPGGAVRLEQRSVGFAATLVNGQVLTRDAEATEARPGRLLRSPMAAAS
jgi:N-acyl-D-amino-acid deacylase